MRRPHAVQPVDVKLTADDLRVIEDAAAKIEVQGKHYHEALEALTYE